jgi:hypothetical protein
MIMDVDSPVSKCFGMPTKPHLQKVIFSLLEADEFVLSLNINIDNDSVRK